MKRTIKWQLLLSFVSLSFILVGAFSWITLNLLESHFADYVRERQESELEEYSTDLENLYQQKRYLGRKIRKQFSVLGGMLSNSQ